MDWKKIISASKWPILISIIIAFVNPFIIKFILFSNFRNLQISSMTTEQYLNLALAFMSLPAISSVVVTIGLTFYLGYNGAIKYKLGYGGAAVGGLLQGILCGIASLISVIINVRDYYLLGAVVFYYALILNALGIPIAILIALIGAFIAKKLK